MTKRILIVLVLCLVPLLSFADFGVGAAAFLNSPILIGQDVDTSTVWDNGFTFGGDVRWKFFIFQLEALGLMTFAGDTTALDLYTDVGLAVDLFKILRLSVGAGPNFTYVFGDAVDPSILGFNAKANVDLKFKHLSFGVSYIMGLAVDNGIALNKSTGMLGATVMYWF